MNEVIEREQHTNGHHHQEHHQKHYIHIDHKKYETSMCELTGEQIRKLAVPPISQEYDLWLETKGPGDDRKIEDHERVRIDDCDSFYSAPKQINPGAVVCSC